MATKTKKDVYYFPHDYNPTSDPKMLAFVGEFGAVGYGVYWRIVEMMHECSDHVLPLKKYIYSAIAKQMLTDVEHVLKIVENCIDEFELFESNDDVFWCNRVLRNVEKRIDLIAKKKKAGDASAKARQERKEAEENSTGVQHNSTGVQHNSTEPNKLNKIKLNKTKLDNNNYNNEPIFEKLDSTPFIPENKYSDEEIVEQFEIYKKEYLKQSIANDKFCMSNRIPLQSLESVLNDFNTSKIGEGQTPSKNIVEYRKWVSNWFNKIPEENRQNYRKRKIQVNN